ncbi:hypothetical protein GEMRC1_013875 [Eukaryota sp. GEM-RC1]
MLVKAKKGKKAVKNLNFPSIFDLVICLDADLALCSKRSDSERAMAEEFADFENFQTNLNLIYSAEILKSVSASQDKSDVLSGVEDHVMTSFQVVEANQSKVIDQPKATQEPELTPDQLKEKNDNEIISKFSNLKSENFDVSLSLEAAQPLLIRMSPVYLKF